MNYESKRWVTLIASMVASMCAGFAYAWSVFLKPLVSLFGWTPADVSFTFTMIMSMAATTAIFAGKALDYLRPAQVILIGGVLFGGGIACMGFIGSLKQLYACALIAGIGLGTVYPGGTMSNAVRFFPDKRGMISGLLTAGYGIGPVLWAPVSVALIAYYDVFTTLKILGAVFFVVIGLCSRAISTAPDNYCPSGWTPPAPTTQQDHGVDKNWRQMLRDPLFYFVAAAITMGAISGMILIGHASPIAQELVRISPQAAAAIVGLLAASNTAGRIFWGSMSDKFGRYAIVMALFALGGAGMFALTMVESYVIFSGIIMLLGLCYGGFLALMAPLTADLFGTKYLGVNFGIMFLTIAVAAYAGPLLAAVIKAGSGSYTQAFVTAIFINLAGLVLFGLFILYKKRARK